MKLFIFGLGTRGREYLDALEALSEFEVVGACDVRPEAGEGLRGSISVFSDWENGLRATSPEVVILATPVNGRLDLALKVLESPGLRALICEKPVALGTEQWETLRDRAAEQSVAVIVSHQLRLADEFRELREIVRSGRLGRLLEIQLSCHGGLFDQGIHLLDQVAWLLPEEEVCGVAGTSEGTDDAGLHPGPVLLKGGIRFLSGLEVTLRFGPGCPVFRAGLGPWLQSRVAVRGEGGWAEAISAQGWREVLFQEPGVIREGTSSVVTYREATVRLLHELAVSLEEKRAHVCDVGTSRRSLEWAVRLAASAHATAMHGQPTVSQQDLEVSGVPSGEAGGGVRLSIVVPLSDHRGYLNRMLTAWCRRQTAASEVFQMVLVMDRFVVDREEEIRSYMRAHDRLIRHDAETEMSQYDAGIAEAEAGLVFLTEAHAWPDPDAVVEILRTFDEHTDWAGFCVRDLPVTPGVFGRMEERMFSGGFWNWSRPESWIKVILRGCAVRKSAYEACGGFSIAHKRFAEWLLAATLHQRGYTMGFAPSVAIRHYYSSDMNDLIPHIRDFSMGELQWRRENPDAAMDNYFSAPQIWLESGSWSREVRELSLRSLNAWVEAGGGLESHAVRTKETENLRKKLRLRRLMGPRFHWLAESLRSLCLGWKCRLLSWNDENLYPIYLRYYDSLISESRWRYLIQEGVLTEPIVLEDLGECSADKFHPTSTFGFHALEEFGRGKFRWAETIAGIRLQLPCGHGRVTVRLATCHDGVRMAGAILTWNGKPLRMDPRDPDRTRCSGTLVIAEGVSEGWLMVVAPGAVATADDPRDLALPVSSVHYTSDEGEPSGSA